MNKEFKIEGMSCGHCVMAVEKELNKLKLIKKRVEIGSAKVEFNPNDVSEPELVNAIKNAGYNVIQ
ncbi:MAG: cation transporter [Ignavibacteriaceae bacterium]|jgi:copper chaperone